MNNKQIICRVAIYPLIALAAGCIVAASCLLGVCDVASYCLYGGAVAAFAAQFFVALGYRLNKKIAVNGFEQWATCWIVTGVVLAFVVFSWLIALLRIVDAVGSRALSRHSELDS